MAVDATTTETTTATTTATTTTTIGTGTTTDETSPLLGNGPSPNTVKAAKPARTIFSPANRILLAGFMMSFTLGITQVPINYVFHLMECDVFYAHNPPFEGPGDRCHRREISAGTATQVSILGMSTSFSGVFNLFVCGYFIKLWGPRWAFVSQTALLGLRVSTQIIAVTIGGRKGIIIFQACQAIGIVGGPRGFQLVLNTAVSALVAPKDRTAVFGRLQGSIMLGTAFGFLLGGVLGDLYNIRRPFETAFFLYVVSSVYGALFLPTGTGDEPAGRNQNSRGISGFFAPIKMIAPHSYRLESGKVVRSYSLIFLALGIFLGVFSSGYVPILLQMYATSEFNFGTTENGYLMFGNAAIRGVFLLFMFPKIISVGRSWFNGTSTSAESEQPRAENRIPVNPEEFEADEVGEVPQEPIQPPVDEEDSGTGFDLFFVRWSLVVDATVTVLAGFSSEGWHVYLAGFLLPFASGSAPAAKGVMTELCLPHQRQDAISAITLVESTAALLTQGLFGMILAYFSEIGRPSLTFFCNAGFAVLGFIVLFMAHLPPANSKRIDEEDSETEAEG